MTIQEHVVAIQNIVTDLEDLESVLKERVTELRSQESEAITDFNKARAELQAYQLDARERIGVLRDSLEAQEDQLLSIKESIMGLSAKKADLLVENAKLETQNREFREYEGKALKILQNQEQSLIKREEIIQQKEQLTGGNKSFLPPVN